MVINETTLQKRTNNTEINSYRRKADTGLSAITRSEITNVKNSNQKTNCLINVHKKNETQLCNTNTFFTIIC